MTKRESYRRKSVYPRGSRDGSGNPTFLDAPRGKPLFSSASSDPIRPCCLPRLFDRCFPTWKGSTIASYSGGETGGRVHCDPLVHRRPTCPRSSPLSSRTRLCNSVKNCDCFTFAVISSRKIPFSRFVLPSFKPQ